MPKFAKFARNSIFGHQVCTGMTLQLLLQLIFCISLVLAGSLSSTSVTSDTQQAGASGVDVTFSFTTTEVLPLSGKIVIDFPSEYDVSSVSTAASLAGQLDGSLSVGVSSNTVTLTYRVKLVFFSKTKSRANEICGTRCQALTILWDV